MPYYQLSINVLSSHRAFNKQKIPFAITQQNIRRNNRKFGKHEYRGDETFYRKEK